MLNFCFYIYIGETGKVMLDNNINNNKQQPIQFKALSPQQAAQQQVAMQAVNPELLKENVQDSYVANRIGETTEDPKGMLYTAALTVPTWFAISKGMDVYSNIQEVILKILFIIKLGSLGMMLQIM